MAVAPEDVVNMALGVIGYSPRIGDLFEGTKAARLALDLYSETRDETLRMDDWPFARRTATLSLLKAQGTPPYGGGDWTNAYPPPGWLYEFACPSDLIQLRAVAPSPITYPVLSPKTVRYSFYNDPTVLNAAGQASRTIITNINPAICNYTGQVLDPTTWEPLFLNAVVQTLANKFKYALVDKPELQAKEMPQEEATAIGVAETRSP